MGTHEQSIGATNEWYTPPEVFAALDWPDFDLDAGSPGVQPTCQVASRPAHGHCAELLALDR